ncbi:MAG: SDR family NAD(P)-dependent oxidoreductase [Hyphomonadaceae bacterium]
MTPLRFDGQAALVTGAGGGLGKQYALDLARRGARVMVNDIGMKDGHYTAAAVAAEIRNEGFQAFHDISDVGTEHGAQAMVDATVAAFGDINLLVNNAGMNVNGVVHEASTADFLAEINVHLMGALWTMRAAIPRMRAQNYGRIVNTSSALGAFAGVKSAPYITAKAAIMGLSKSAALDNEDRDIRINALAPLAVTPLAAGYLAIKPETLGQLNMAKLGVNLVSPAVLYLLHRSCTLNGEMLAAGGGRVARIFAATGPGYIPDELTAEGIAENLERIMDTMGFIIPRTSAEQYSLLPK